MWSLCEVMLRDPLINSTVWWVVYLGQDSRAQLSVRCSSSTRQHNALIGQPTISASGMDRTLIGQDNCQHTDRVCACVCVCVRACACLCVCTFRERNPTSYTKVNDFIIMECEGKINSNREQNKNVLLLKGKHVQISLWAEQWSVRHKPTSELFLE